MYVVFIDYVLMNLSILHKVFLTEKQDIKLIKDFISMKIMFKH